MKHHLMLLGLASVFGLSALIFLVSVVQLARLRYHHHRSRHRRRHRSRLSRLLRDHLYANESLRRPART